MHEFGGHTSAYNRDSLFPVTVAITLQSTELEAGVGAGILMEKTVPAFRRPPGRCDADTERKHLTSPARPSSKSTTVPGCVQPPQIGCSRSRQKKELSIQKR